LGLLSTHKGDLTAAVHRVARCQRAGRKFFASWLTKTLTRFFREGNRCEMNYVHRVDCVHLLHFAMHYVHIVQRSSEHRMICDAHCSQHFSLPTSSVPASSLAFRICVGMITRMPLRAGPTTEPNRVPLPRKTPRTSVVSVVRQELRSAAFPPPSAYVKPLCDYKVHKRPPRFPKCFDHLASGA
jgi:hypothetical protein